MENEKVCKRCNMSLPLEKFRLRKSQYGKPYYRGVCKKCEYEIDKEYRARKREKDFIFSDDLEIISKRKFKTIDKARILDISKIGIDIVLLGPDEIFVKQMDCKDTWLSNYGRMIRKPYGKYNLLEGSYYNGELFYSVRKNVFCDGRWIYKQSHIYAHKAVVDTFIINEDKANNTHIWHSKNDKADCYYKNLYSLNQKQFEIVQKYYMKTGDVSEEFILKVMNDIRYKPEEWSKKVIKPVMYDVGCHGLLYTNSKEEAYQRWHWMMNRCYSKAIHELQPEYKNCSVCDEWLNYSNFKLWYDEKKDSIKAFDEAFEMDKDILIKGNTVYSPETVCFVPKNINSLFINHRNKRGECPLGVYLDKDKKKYRAEMNLMGKIVKLGTFNRKEKAFTTYKGYKEDFIKDMAEQYKEKIPNKVYQAMTNWKIEITD